MSSSAKVVQAINDLKKSLTGCGNPSNGSFTPTVVSTSGSSTIQDGLYKYSISNVGAASGTVDGQAFPVGATIVVEAYYDEVTKKLVRPLGISYDATGTTFLISTTP